MKKGLVVLIIAIVAIGGIATAVLLHDKSSKQISDTSMPGMDTNKKSTDTSDTAAVATTSVSINDFSFGPASITVKKGATVTWTNSDSAPHTVTGDNGGPDSGTLQQGDTYTFTFNDVGTFAYHCKIHSSMTAKVVVTE